MASWMTTVGIVLIAIVFYAALGWGILKIYRWYRRRAETVINRAYAGLKPHWPAFEGDVTLQFHTYYGFFVWFTQTEHRTALPPDQARILLRRLHHHNLVWGLLCPFVVVVPTLSLAHYWQQMRSIKH